MKDQAFTSLPAAPTRRKLMQAGGVSLALAALGAPALVRAQSGPKIRIGYWPIAAGLPFYAALELGYFKDAGLNVEPLRFAAAQQVMEAVLADRSDGTANGTGSANSPLRAPSRSSASTPATTSRARALFTPPGCKRRCRRAVSPT